MRAFVAVFVIAGLAVGVVRAEEAMTERMIRKEIVVDAPVADVWNAWTTAEGLRFISAKSNVELWPGGPYEWFLDLEPDHLGKRGGEGARVLSYVPHEVLSFSWNFPPAVPTLRDAGAMTAVVVQFDDLGDGRTRVRFTQMGWREGEDWDAGYAYFDRAWSAVLERLRTHFPQGS